MWSEEVTKEEEEDSGYGANENDDKLFDCLFLLNVDGSIPLILINGPGNS